MLVAVVSDVHANLQALRTVLGRLERERPDRIVCLGDVVGYGGDPEACVALVRERIDTVVMGNHDAAAVHPWARAGFHSYARDAVEAHAAWLDDSALGFLRELPAAAHIGGGGSRGLYLTHGTPGEDYPFTYLVSEAQAAQALESFPERFGVVGHTHVPAVFEADPGSSRARSRDPGPAPREGAGGSRAAALGVERDETFEVVFTAGARAVLNPGSVGQPRDGDPRASCLLLDVPRGSARWLRLVYDVPAAQAAIRRRGLPEILAARLAVGR